MDDDVVSGSSRGDRVDVSLTDAARDAHRQVTAPSGAFFIFLSWRFSVCLVFFLPLPLLCRRHFFFLFFFLAHFIPHQTWSILVCVCVSFLREKSRLQRHPVGVHLSAVSFLFSLVLFFWCKNASGVRRHGTPWNAPRRDGAPISTSIDLSEWRWNTRFLFSFLFFFGLSSVVSRFGCAFCFRSTKRLVSFITFHF